ncbi:MAG TPA: DUF1570 domain-containing protein [Pirellulales bacterium]|jgi:hypothetical protein|nr:DUF1570 domain-containing protein [Pirellulales bacterium]
MAASLPTIRYGLRPTRSGIARLTVGLAIAASFFGGEMCAWAANGAPRFMIEATVHGRRIEGAPLSWSAGKVWLLARDGRLWDFAPQEATDFRKTASYFAPYSAREITALLQLELGRRFDVSSTAHYLVCHPPGQAVDWGERFEQMFRQFGHYFSVRGLNLRQPDMPMVAIVFTSRTDFLHYSMGDGFRPGPEVLGYYSPRTNRVAMYDGSELQSQGPRGDWRQSAAMLVHEAAHQAAFNTGIHSRLNSPPQWLAEGLATLFEARGVWNSDQYRKLSDRVNQSRLADFRRFASGHPSPDWIQSLVSSDRPFTMDVAGAYAESWALTFYLSEKQPAAYSKYLATTAARPAFRTVDATDRVADFSHCFGDDWRMLDARVRRFLADLR